MLRHFAGRNGISYPMLSDPESKVIRAFGILNDNFPPGHPWHGVPFPGTYVIDARGMVQAKFFEEDYRERYTAASILAHQFGGSGSTASSTAETNHLKISARAADAAVKPGSRTVLTLDVELKPGMHVYAPGVEGYIPIDWRMAESKAWLAHPPAYRAGKILHMAAIRETVPVYEGRFRITRDLTIGQNSEISPLLSADRELVVEGFSLPGL